MISVQDLTKVYGEQRAIDHINFEIGAGEIVGFLGPNGAGKTTTMKILTCFMAPTSGNVTVDEFNIFDHGLDIRRKIGYLPEHNPLYLDMYVHEYLRFVGKLYGLKKQDLEDRVQDVVIRTGLHVEQHKKIGMLSKGYRQRVGLCQAMIHDPDILILDEPTTGLDPNQIVEIRSLIKEIGREKTIIFSSHILAEVEAIADRVIIINKGQIVADEQMDVLRSGGIDQNLLRVGFEKPGFDFGPVLADRDEVTLTQTAPLEYTLRSPSGTDLRRQILEQSLAQDNPLVLLQKVEKNLEEIFRSLTQST